MYSWNNEKKLSTLRVTGDGDKLVFETDTEKAVVHLKGNDIESVECFFDNDNFTVNKSERHHVVVGHGNAERDVYHYLKPGGKMPFMRLGITKHKGLGTWSSLPHGFENNLEPGFEEVFFYLINGGTARGIQVGRGVWYDNAPVDSVWQIHDKTFSTVPMGYHPVVAEPEVNVSYVWVYLAKKKSWEKI